jgi:hypothetical protein
MNPFLNRKFDQDTFLAEVEKIIARMRTRREQLAADRSAFWTRATAPVSDEQWDHDTERWNNGEGEV